MLKSSLWHVFLLVDQHRSLAMTCVSFMFLSLFKLLFSFGMSYDYLIINIFLVIKYRNVNITFRWAFDMFYYFLNFYIHQNTHNQAGIVHYGGLPPLLELLDSRDGALQHNVAFSIYGLADNEVRDTVLHVVIFIFYFWSILYER